MADAVDTEVLHNGNNRYVVRLTNVSDGTGEANVVKIDRSALIGPDQVNPPSKLVIEEISCSVIGFEGVLVEWHNPVDGTADETAAVLAHTDYRDYRREGGLVPDSVPVALSDVIGDIKFTTLGTPVANDTYDIKLTLRLKV